MYFLVFVVYQYDRLPACYALCTMMFIWNKNWYITKTLTKDILSKVRRLFYSNCRHFWDAYFKFDVFISIWFRPLSASQVWKSRGLYLSEGGFFRRFLTWGNFHDVWTVYHMGRFCFYNWVILTKTVPGCEFQPLKGAFQGFETELKQVSGRFFLMFLNIQSGGGSFLLLKGEFWHRVR